MKKLVLMFLSLICAVAVYADGSKACKVSGTTGSVVVSSFDVEDGAMVTFSNDTDEYVNVTAGITFVGSDDGRQVSKMVPPRSEATIKVPGKGRSNVSFVTGTKCQ